eukprot:scaffold8646_cov115-Isochrysis_galbana.AAC.1
MPFIAPIAYHRCHRDPGCGQTGHSDHSDRTAVTRDSCADRALLRMYASRVYYAKHSAGLRVAARAHWLRLIQVRCRGRWYW